MKTRNNFRRLNKKLKKIDESLEMSKYIIEVEVKTVEKPEDTAKVVQKFEEIISSNKTCYLACVPSKCKIRW